MDLIKALLALLAFAVWVFVLAVGIVTLPTPTPAHAVGLLFLLWLLR